MHQAPRVQAQNVEVALHHQALIGLPQRGAGLVEAEYGFTIETYQETITIEGQAMLVDIFRLGRISLFYQSLDRKRCGFYHTADGAWRDLAKGHNLAIQTAIDIAAKRRPIELLNLPVGRMVAQ